MPAPASSEGASYSEIHAIPVWGMGEVTPGDSIADLIVDTLALGGLRLRAGDILVVKHKIVSKAEGRMVDLASVKPSAAARRFANKNGSDARVIELALREAKRVVRKQHVLITETSHGLVCANSGIDVSNVDGGNTAVLLPLDPDASAARIMRKLKRRTTLHVPVIIADSFGRAWREGLHEVAIGLAGMAPHARLSRPARCLRLPDALQRRVCCRRTRLPRGAGLRKKQRRSRLYNSGLSVSPREGKCSPDCAARFPRLVSLSAHRSSRNMQSAHLFDHARTQERDAILELVQSTIPSRCFME